MKIEVYPSNMTVAELTDLIAELDAQRNVLLEQKRENAEERCHDAFTEALGQVWEYTESGNFNATLTVKTVNGRRHFIPLNMEQVEEWHIEVERKMGQ